MEIYLISLIVLARNAKQQRNYSVHNGFEEMNIANKKFTQNVHSKLSQGTSPFYKLFDQSTWFYKQCNKTEL